MGPRGRRRCIWGRQYQSWRKNGEWNELVHDLGQGSMTGFVYTVMEVRLP